MRALTLVCTDTKPLSLHEDPKLGVFVRGALEQIVGSLADVLKLVQKGEMKRKTGLACTRVTISSPGVVLPGCCPARCCPARARILRTRFVIAYCRAHYGADEA
jgi:hypothetical protein